jgi:hypothetical protein
MKLPASVPAVYYRVGIYVGKILQGEKVQHRADIIEIVSS